MLFSLKWSSTSDAGEPGAFLAIARSTSSMTLSIASATLEVWAEKAIARLRKLVFSWRKLSSRLTNNMAEVAATRIRISSAVAATRRASE